jgi:NADPH2:quinone reductase
VSFEAGACLGIPALTAWHAVELAGPVAGKTLLVAGGAGAVAHYAIQFAKAAGANVIATVSSAAKAKIARDAGADHTIDYKSENVGERVAAITGKPASAGGGVDAVLEIDLTANAALLPSVLRPKGAVVVYGTGPQAQIPASFCLVNSIRLLFMLVYELSPEERRRGVEGITRLLEQNKLIHNVGATFAFKDIATAHQAQESGSVAGNIVLQMG